MQTVRSLDARMNGDDHTDFGGPVMQVNSYSTWTYEPGFPNKPQLNIVRVRLEQAPLVVVV